MLKKDAFGHRSLFGIMFALYVCNIWSNDKWLLYTAEISQQWSNVSLVTYIPLAAFFEVLAVFVLQKMLQAQ